MPSKEPCPVCGRVHERGEYELRPGTNQYSPRDVKCECGLTLRWSVPLFKMTESGGLWRPLRTDETPFI